MDILQVIKDEHRRVTQLLEQLRGASGDAAAQLWSDLHQGITLHLSLEINELFPELEESLGWFSEYKAHALQRHEAVLDAVVQYDRAFVAQKASELQTAWEALVQSVQSHIAHEETLLFPKIRQKLATVTREDLGELFLELQQEALLGAGRGANLRQAPSAIG